MMAIRPRLYGLDDDVLEDIYRTGTDAARGELRAPDMEFTLEETENAPAPTMEFSLEETEPDLPGIGREPMGTIDPWGDEPSAPTGQAPRSLTIPSRTPGFASAGAFSRDARLRPTGALAPLPDVSPTLQPMDDVGVPQRSRPPMTTVGTSSAPLSARGMPVTAVRTPLLGIAPEDDVGMPQEADDLPGIGNKSGYSPYDLTGKERDRLARAERSDRNLGIASGVMRGLMSLAQLGTAAAGNTAAATGIGQGMSGLEPWDNRVSARVGESIGRDRDLRVQSFERQRAEEDRATAAEMQAEDRAFRQQQQQSSIDLANERAEMIRAQRAQADLELDAARGNAEGMRRTIQAFAETTNPDTQGGQQLRALVASPEFARMDAPTLREVFGRFTALASTRHSGLLRGGGGTASGYTEVVNPDGTVTRVSTGGGGGGGGGGGARTRIGGGGGGNVQQLPPASNESIAIAEAATGAPLSTGEDAIAEILIQAIRAEGIDPASPEGRQVLRARLFAYRNAPTSVQGGVVNDALETIGSAAAEQAGGLPPGVTQRELQLMNAGGANSPAAAFTAMSSLRRMISRFEYYHLTQPRALEAVLRGAGTQEGVLGEGLDLVANQIRQDLQGMINRTLSDLAGANVTPNEMVRNLRMFGVGSYGSNWDDFYRGMQRQQTDLQEEFRSRSISISPRARAYWIEQAHANLNRQPRGGR